MNDLQMYSLPYGIKLSGLLFFFSRIVLISFRKTLIFLHKYVLHHQHFQQDGIDAQHYCDSLRMSRNYCAIPLLSELAALRGPQRSGYSFLRTAKIREQSIPRNLLNDIDTTRNLDASIQIRKGSEVIYISKYSVTLGNTLGRVASG